MISKFFIERPILANVIAILIVVIGAVAVFGAAGGAISQCRAADRAGDDPLSRRQRAHRHRHGRAAHRAAGQRRRRHDLHAVLRRRRRLLYAHRHLQDRHRSELRAGAGAEPRPGGAFLAAAGRAVARRGGAEEVDRDPSDRHADFAAKPLRQPVPGQLRHHQSQGRDFAPAGRRQRGRVRRRRIRHARVARSAEDEGARPQRAGRDQRAAAAERAGDGGTDRRATGARKRAVPVHAQRRRPPRQCQPVRQRHRQDRLERSDHAHSRHRPCRTRRADLRPDLYARRQAGGRPRRLPVARRQCPQRRARGQAAHDRALAGISAGARLRHSVRHHDLRQRLDRRSL